MISEKYKNHPLEEVFDLDSGSTYDLVEVEDNYMSVNEEQVNKEYEDDTEDKEINEKIETIYSAAMDAYENQTAMVEIMEPRYAARNAEVAANYLNTALNAVALKSKNKIEKRKTKSFIPFGGNTITNSNVVVSDRNSILEMIRKKNELKNEN
jgi:hypothetical protein